MSIEILRPEVIDQIAAGEVVERPAHLIKELVENSLDAKATRIEIHFADGGRWVRIVDDGIGMSPEDLPKSLERFATSKIKQTEDLWKLRSFGFRGEALASIAAVSELQLVSREAGAKTAHRLISRYGTRDSVDPQAGPPGTSILIEKLFENVPARLKFLKSAAAESGAIKTAIKALALANPDVEFKVFEQGVLRFFWNKTESFLERARQVLEIKDLYEGSAVREHVHARALFSSPHEIAKTSKNIWIFAQNRWIQDRSAQAAVMEAYRNLLMHGEFPYAVVFLEVDPEEIDVNIHPTKSQVKFRDPGLVFRAVQAALRETLERAPWLKPQGSQGSLSGTQEIKKETSILPLVRKVSQDMPSPSFLKTSDYARFTEGRSFASPLAGEVQRSEAEKSEVHKLEALAPVIQQALPSTEGYWQSFDIVGQVYNTYLVCQGKDKMMLVDQHAAHERVLFEKIIKGIRERNLESQEFLFPLAVDLNPEKVEALESVSEDLKKLGITLENLGPNTIGVRSAPPLIKDAVLPEVLEKLSGQILEHGHGFAMDHYISELVSTMACHSAVRAGQSLSYQEMKALLVQMDEFPLSSFCPHGRPVSVDYSISKIERDFGRTV